LPVSRYGWTWSRIAESIPASLCSNPVRCGGRESIPNDLLYGLVGWERKECLRSGDDLARRVMDVSGRLGRIVARRLRRENRDPVGVCGLSIGGGHENGLASSRTVAHASCHAYLRDLATTWHKAEGGAGRRILAEALFERIDALGFREATLLLTDTAIAHGFAEVIPERIDLTVGYGRGERI
jgi:hypothetical protein